MSDMLEQAIVDAEALKEAALKTAKQEILEMYSKDVKNAVDTILEQDELGMEMPEEEMYVEGMPEEGMLEEELGMPEEEPAGLEVAGAEVPPEEGEEATGPQAASPFV